MSAVLIVAGAVAGVAAIAAGATLYALAVAEERHHTNHHAWRHRNHHR